MADMHDFQRNWRGPNVGAALLSAFWIFAAFGPCYQLGRITKVWQQLDYFLGMQHVVTGWLRAT